MNSPRVFLVTCFALLNGMTNLAWAAEPETKVIFRCISVKDHDLEKVGGGGLALVIQLTRRGLCNNDNAIPFKDSDLPSLWVQTEKDKKRKRPCILFLDINDKDLPVSILDFGMNKLRESVPKGTRALIYIRILHSK
jgi:hypothetical protein